MCIESAPVECAGVVASIGLRRDLWHFPFTNCPKARSFPRWTVGTGSPIGGPFGSGSTPDGHRLIARPDLGATLTAWTRETTLSTRRRVRRHHSARRFESIAHVLFEAAEFRREPWNGAIGFRELGRDLASRIRTAERRYADSELQLQSVAEAEGCAHREALAAIRRVNDAIGHVILGVVPDHMAVAHVRQVPAPDVAGLLRRMRQQVSRAAHATSAASQTGVAMTAAPNPHPETVTSSPNGNAPVPRLCCDDSDRSVYLDEKRIVGEVELSLFRFFKVIAEAYPNPIPFKAIQERAPGLHGKHRTRDLKDRLPPALAALVQSGKHGYLLKLPAPK